MEPKASARQDSSTRLEACSAPTVVALGGKASRLAVTRDSRFCAVLYDDQLDTVAEDRSDQEPASEIIEIWDMQTATRHSRLCLSSSEGRDEHGTVDELILNAEYIFINRHSTYYTEVRRWRSSQHIAEPSFPMVWSHAPEDGGENYLGAMLLSPHFIALQVLAFSAREEGDEPLSHLHFFRIEQAGSRLVATFSMLGATEDTSYFDGTINCGNQIVPGEDGLVVIEVLKTHVSL